MRLGLRPSAPSPWGQGYHQSDSELGFNPFFRLLPFQQRACVSCRWFFWHIVLGFQRFGFYDLALTTAWLAGMARARWAWWWRAGSARSASGNHSQSWDFWCSQRIPQSPCSTLRMTQQLHDVWRPQPSWRYFFLNFSCTTQFAILGSFLYAAAQRAADLACSLGRGQYASKDLVSSSVHLWHRAFAPRSYHHIENESSLVQRLLVSWTLGLLFLALELFCRWRPCQFVVVKMAWTLHKFQVLVIQIVLFALVVSFLQLVDNSRPGRLSEKVFKPWCRNLQISFGVICLGDQFYFSFFWSICPILFRRFDEKGSNQA